MEQLQIGADQSMINGSKEDNFSYGQTLTCSPHRHKMSFMSIQISRSDLSDDGGSITFVEHANIQKKGSLEVKKFIYPRFKRRAYYDVTTGTLQCFSKKEKKMEARLRAKFASCTSSNILSEDEALQKKGDGDKSHHHPREISLRDIVVCESPSNALEFRSKNELLPRICTATPNPVTRNPAFRIMDSPCAETFPHLNFASLGDQSDEQLALLKCSVRSVTSFTGEKIFPHRTNEATDKINILNLATNSNDLRKITLEADAQLDELEKENNPPPLSSNNKAIFAYRSMQKAKKRSKSKPGFLSSSSRNSNDNDADFLRTRNYGRLSLVLGNKQTSLGPILRSFRNTQAITRSLKQVQMSVRRSKKSFVKALLEKYIWNQRIKFGSPNHREACLPFLNGKVGRRVECFYCREFITSYDSTICSYKDCCRSYHLTCARGLPDFNFRKNGDAVCPQHACMVCRGYNKSKVFRCDRCIVSAHMNCFAFPEFCTFLDSKPNHFICWRHPEDWRHDSEHKAITTDTKEAFKRLPLPYSQVQFSIGSNLLMEISGNDIEPPPFIHIRRNIFLVKKKRDDIDDGVGCSCKESCQENCECRAQTMSCSKSCVCNERCGNKPFRREKKYKLVKTLACGWGVQSCERISRGEFIVEYVGEVINEAMCEERLWTMKERGDHNFYMCEIGKDFIIDATFKGNASRFVNHSCDPNCILQKWRVDGEIRIGIFAIRDIKDGEPLTYDYRFVQFGPSVKCQCGSRLCRGNLGESYQQKSTKQLGFKSTDIPAWGEKHRRSQKSID